ncbi:antibiotic biosynthesis monooxygenase family protein [Labedaea rhizosphaerae]|uniref:Heme-degrading monooxygenase HmoA n=1 Tax=Labedaea rhizosphaerae TaxID=598644 RepID=A0A4R6SB77_LABRH|nr:antibiotic biosynthesis monooxygenase [Labedaea rhizosphaerae]TDP96125.1 heme-degrading monooxygenase HmoA [Labedaea rhizosphaerae]
MASEALPPGPGLAGTPEPPYYAVIFSSRLGPDDEGYHETAQRMDDLVREQPGFLGADYARGEDRVGITVAYFQDEESIKNWRADLEHAQARARGRGQWYDAFRLRVAKVERQYGFTRDTP